MTPPNAIEKDNGFMKETGNIWPEGWIDGQGL